MFEITENCTEIIGFFPTIELMPAGMITIVMILFEYILLCSSLGVMNYLCCSPLPFKIQRALLFVAFYQLRKDLDICIS